MDSKTGNGATGAGPKMAEVDDQISALAQEADDPDWVRRAERSSGAIAFVHFDPGAARSQMAEALVHHDDIPKLHRGLYTRIDSIKDGRQYVGRVVEGPFFNPDALKRDSTPVQFIILNQGQGKVLSVPEYHAWVQIEILGEEQQGALFGAMRRPHPASPIFAFESERMTEMLHLDGNIRLGMLNTYENIWVQIDGDDKGVVPRNWLTVGTVGSGKSNTNQVFIEETLDAGYAQVVVDPEGEYIFMDQPSDAPGVADELAKYDRASKGVSHLTVYRPPLSASKRDGAVEFSVPFDSLAPEVIQEMAQMSPAQQTRFTFLYEQASRVLRKRAGQDGIVGDDDLDVSRGHRGMTLQQLLWMVNQELEYYQWKRDHPDRGAAKTRRKATAKDEDAEPEDADGPDMKIYCHEYQLQPLISDQHDVVSFSALRKKLRELQLARIFDRPDAPALNMETLSEPGHLSVIDMSDARSQFVVNIVIADLLARMYRHKMGLTEQQNTERKVILTIEEAHGFVSRDNQDKMEQTMDQLRRIARRGRKRWLALHFVTQSPQHLPSEMFELANNKIIHQTTGLENLRVLKAAAGSVNEGIWNDVPSMGRGRAIIVSSQYPHPIMVQIRPAASRRNYMI